MRIAVWHNLPSGGAKRALFNQIKGLVARGHSVDVWCPPTADRYFLPLSSFAVEHVIPLALPLIEARTRIGKVANPLILWFNTKIMENHCRKCAELIDSRNYDVVLSAPCQYVITPSIGRYLKTPSVLFLHEPNRGYYEALPIFRWAAVQLPKRLADLPGYAMRKAKDILWLPVDRWKVRSERDNAGAFSALIANSYFSRENILRAYGLNAEVCYLGVDSSVFRSAALRKQNYIICVGALRSEKGADFIISSVATIASNRPAVIWVANMVIPKYRRHIERLAQSHGVEFRIKINITDNELIEVLDSARLMVYAPTLEPFGFAPLEASSMGLPILAVAEGGVRETVIDQHNGLLVPKDVYAMGHAIVRLLNDSVLSKKLGKNGQQWVRRHWTWERSVENLERLLDSISR